MSRNQRARGGDVWNMSLRDAQKMFDAKQASLSLERVFSSMPAWVRLNFEEPFLKDLQENCNFIQASRRINSEVRDEFPNGISFDRAVEIVDAILARAKMQNDFPRIVEVSASANGRGGSPKTRRSSASSDSSPASTEPTSSRDITGSFEYNMYLLLIAWALVSAIRTIVQLLGPQIDLGWVDFVLALCPMPFTGTFATKYIQDTAVAKMFKIKLLETSPSLQFGKESRLYQHRMTDGNAAQETIKLLPTGEIDGTTLAGAQAYFKKMKAVAKSMGATITSNADDDLKCTRIDIKSNLKIDISVVAPRDGHEVTIPQFLCFNETAFSDLPYPTRLGLVERQSENVLEDARNFVEGLLDNEHSADTFPAEMADAAFYDSLRNIGMHYITSAAVGIFFTKFLFGTTQFKDLSTSKAYAGVGALFWGVRTISIVANIGALFYTMPSLRTEALVTIAGMAYSPKAWAMLGTAAAATFGLLLGKTSQEGILSKTAFVFSPLVWITDLKPQTPMSNYSKDLVQQYSKETGKNPLLVTEQDLEKYRRKQKEKAKAEQRQSDNDANTNRKLVLSKIRETNERIEKIRGERSALQKESAAVPQWMIRELKDLEILQRKLAIEKADLALVPARVQERARQNALAAAGSDSDSDSGAAASAAAALSAVGSGPDEIEAAARLLLSSGMFF